MKYDMQKHELTLEINGSPVKLTFESSEPGGSIWHYVFSALGERELSSVQPPDTPLE